MYSLCIAIRIKSRHVYQDTYIDAVCIAILEHRWIVVALSNCLSFSKRSIYVQHYHVEGQKLENEQFHNYLSWVRVSLSMSCPGSGNELSWVWVVLGTSRPGRVRVVLGTRCLGYELSWVRVVLGTRCLGYELTIIHRWVGHWRGALMFSLICDRANGWTNNKDTGDLRRHRAHYDAIVMNIVTDDGLATWGSRPKSSMIFIMILDSFWDPHTKVWIYLIRVRILHYCINMNYMVMSTMMIDINRPMETRCSAFFDDQFNWIFFNKSGLTGFQLYSYTPNWASWASGHCLNQWWFIVYVRHFNVKHCWLRIEQNLSYSVSMC